MPLWSSQRSPQQEPRIFNQISMAIIQPHHLRWSNLRRHLLPLGCRFQSIFGCWHPRDFVELAWRLSACLSRRGFTSSATSVEGSVSTAVSPSLAWRVLRVQAKIKFLHDLESQRLKWFKLDRCMKTTIQLNDERWAPPIHPAISIQPEWCHVSNRNPIL